MNLRAIDLNLLTVLDALLDEAHVTRAAERLGMSQPAVSNALERCRHLFKDPLLLRGQGMMRRTPKADSLRLPLKNLLADALALVEPVAPDLMQLQQTVHLNMPDFAASLVVGQLYADVARTAPGVDLVIYPWRGPAAVLDELTKGTVDLAMATLPPPGASFRMRELRRTFYRVVMRKGHPAAADFSLQRWLSHPHVSVSASGDTEASVDRALLAHQLERRVSLIVPSFLMVPNLLLQSDLIAVVPNRFVPKDDGRFAVFEPPIPLDSFPVHIAWHVRRDKDVVVQHVAGLLADAISNDSGEV
ncbi:LysR family transcriptional regulator [Uliginosibacterium sediminicola]|uniref:LysR substrate-binding domain-containing protein n=1 Tax=Uliginosibacterium sediminicola TaxID=2024550 RepID=A0ABU9YY51_9RHOO